MTKNSNLRAQLIKTIATALIFTTLAAGVTYSWIRRSWTPQISQDNVMIEASGSLAFKLDASDDVSTTKAGLASLMGVENIILKPVSNFSGRSEDFFALERGTPGQERFVHLTKDGTWTDTAKANGYIEVNFQILGRDSQEVTGTTDASTLQWVFFHEDSRLMNSDENEEGDGLKALRMSLTFKDEHSTERTLLFAPDESLESAFPPHTAITNATAVGASGNKYWLASGAYYYSNYETATRTTVATDGTTSLTKYTGDINSIKDYTGGVTHNADGSLNGTLNTQRCLFCMDPSEKVSVTVRIWLEGEDKYCVDDIAGQLLDILVKFDSVCLSSSSN